MINEYCRIYKVICIYKFSAILKILKSARRSKAPLAVTSHLGPSLVLHPRFFLALASERLGLGCRLLYFTTNRRTLNLILYIVYQQESSYS